MRFDIDWYPKTHKPPWAILQVPALLSRALLGQGRGVPRVGAPCKRKQSRAPLSRGHFQAPTSLSKIPISFGSVVSSPLERQVTIEWSRSTQNHYGWGHLKQTPSFQWAYSRQYEQASSRNAQQVAEEERFQHQKGAWRIEVDWHGAGDFGLSEAIHPSAEQPGLSRKEPDEATLQLDWAYCKDVH